jgi:uncharacterized protein YhjY with autotransporter beta-barrel domain
MKLPNSKLIKRYIVRWVDKNLPFTEVRYTQTSTIATLNDLKRNSVDPSTIQVHAELTSGFKFHVYGNDQ